MSNDKKQRAFERIDWPYTFEDVDGKPLPRVPFSINGDGHCLGETVFNLTQAVDHFSMTRYALRQLWDNTFSRYEYIERRIIDLYGTPVPVRKSGYKGEETLMTIDEAAKHFDVSEGLLEGLWSDVCEGPEYPEEELPKPKPPTADEIKTSIEQFEKIFDALVLLAKDVENALEIDMPSCRALLGYHAGDECEAQQEIEKAFDSIAQVLQRLRQALALATHAEGPVSHKIRHGKAA